MAAVEHFEIPVEDIERARAFYRSALDLDYEPWGEDMGMLVQPEGKGINGDLYLRGHVPHPAVVFTVSDMDVSVQRVVAAGGSHSGTSKRCRRRCVGSTSVTPRATSSVWSSTTEGSGTADGGPTLADCHNVTYRTDIPGSVHGSSGLQVRSSGLQGRM